MVSNKQDEMKRVSAAAQPSNTVSEPLHQLAHEMLRRVASKNLYLILCVEPAATTKEIKKKYFHLIKQFHPDRIAASELGITSAQQVAIVKAASSAYAIVSSPEKRQLYHQQRSLPLPPGISSPATPTSGQTSGIAPSIPPGVPHSSTPGAPRSYPPQGRAQPAAPISSVRPPKSNPAVSLSAAVRLRGAPPSSRPPAPSYSQAPGSQQRESYAPPSSDPSLSHLPATEPAQRYVQLMEEAAGAQQWSSAASLGKMAVQMNPENPSVAQRQKEYQDLADKKRAPEYKQEAQGAQDHRDYARAASLFEKAANGMQSASLYDRAAANLKKQEHEPRKLVDLYRQAARLAPDSIEYKLALGKAYMAAGSKKSAQSVLAQAQALDKRNPELKQLLQELKKSDSKG